MAGDWIKIEHATTDKAEVLRISEMLGISRRECLGLLIDFWVWLDRNCYAPSVTNATLLSRKSCDDVTHTPGFAACLEAVGWAKFNAEDGKMWISNLERHNGEPAKSRALAKNRMQRFRNDSSVTIASQEKRREEKKVLNYKVKSEVIANAPTRAPAVKEKASPRKATRLPEGWALPEEWRDWAGRVHAVDAQRAVRISLDFRDYWHAKAGAQACKLDWFATWRRWVRRECGDA